jgi:hypothetical protein
MAQARNRASDFRVLQRDDYRSRDDCVGGRDDYGGWLRWCGLGVGGRRGHDGEGTGQSGGCGDGGWTPWLSPFVDGVETCPAHGSLP